jgi:hypothetical protein
MKFLISEEEKSRILEMHQNATSRQYLTEGLGNTTLQLQKAPLAINRTVCSTGMDQFLVTFEVKNTGTEVAYLSRVAVTGKGLGAQQQLDHKASIGGISKHSNHDNGAEQAIVPAGKAATITVIVKTRLSEWTAKITELFNQLRAEKNPKKRTELEAQYKAARTASPFDAAGTNQVYVEYNGGSLYVPLDIKNLKLGNTSCEAPIDLARGF